MMITKIIQMKKYMILGIFLSIIAPLYSQSFYDINTINTIEITFEESNWDALLDQLVNNGEEERLMGSVNINGQVFDSVGVRYKGNSSYNSNQVKNPLNIKLDYIINDQEIEGFGTLKLSNVYKDPTFVREVMSYEIARKYFPAGLSNYTNVYINGTHLGLYTSDQDVDKFFMRTHFGSDENMRMKGEIESGVPPGQMGGVWEYFGSDSSDYFGVYTLESNYGWNEMVSFLDTLNNVNEEVENVLNMDRHLWFLAFQNLLVNLDGPINNPQNYYVYKDDNGRMNPIPWDLNESFGVFTMLQSGGPQSTSQLQQLDPFVNLNNSDYPIISKVLNNETYRKMYVAHMKTILEENFSNDWYYERALEIQYLIDADVQADANKFYSYANFISNINNAVGGGPNSVIGITQLMDARINYIESYTDFQYSPPQIGDIAFSPEQVTPNSQVWFTAEVEDATQVILAYRNRTYQRFTNLPMFDDGNHEDGAANDGIYGVLLEVGSTDVQYYFYAENMDASAFLPVRAEYEFYSIEVTGDLVINELMADNENAVADQDGEFDDWIELYNNSNTAINLDGYYLSDNAADPGQWAFPDTTILAGDYLIIWADKDIDQFGLHADFKLSASGEGLFLSDADMNLLDQISFLQQKADTSYGRIPNGRGHFEEMLPTFGEENQALITAVEEIPEDHATFVLEQNSPNPFSQETTIRFKLDESSFVNMQIVNMFGQVIETLESAQLNSGSYQYQWKSSSHVPGVYFCVLKANNESKMKKMLLLK